MDTSIHTNDLPPSVLQLKNAFIIIVVIVSLLQPIVSALFVIEIAGVLVAHLFYSPSQCRLFYTNSYYWYLTIVAVCSMIASIPVKQLYNPHMVSNGLAFFQVSFNVLRCGWRGRTVVSTPLSLDCIELLYACHQKLPCGSDFPRFPFLSLSRSIFLEDSYLFLYVYLKFLFTVHQALRLPRAIRLFPPLKRFVFKILGGGLKLLVVFLIVAVFLVWFAVVSMQIFGYLDSEPGCDRFNIDESFGNFFYVRLFCFVCMFLCMRACLHCFFTHSGFAVHIPDSDARRVDRADGRDNVSS